MAEDVLTFAFPTVADDDKWTLVLPDAALIAMGLNETEQLELKERPMGVLAWRGLTDEQIARRIEIAKKVVDHSAKNDPTMKPWQHALYTQVPVWGFYEAANSESGWPPRRVYGVYGPNRYHAVTLMMAMNNDIIGGIDAASLRRVNRWSEATVKQMRSGFYRGIGLWEDPLGFFALGMK